MVHQLQEAFLQAERQQPVVHQRQAELAVLQQPVAHLVQAERQQRVVQAVRCQLAVASLQELKSER